MGERTVTVATPDGPMAVYEAVPDLPAARAVVVIQEAFGINRHIQDVTRRFADAGYHAVAPALFHRAGGGCIEDYDNIDYDQLLALFAGVTDDTVLGDVDAALGVLREAGYPDERIGVVGFCFGGRATFLVSARRTVGAAVSFYGGGIASSGVLPYPALIDEASTLRTPWLGLFGDADRSIPVEDVERLRGALEAASPPTEIVRYPEAGHGFHCDVRADYHAAAAADAWGRTLGWFDTHLG